jgi:hypothetical protein
MRTGVNSPAGAVPSQAATAGAATDASAAADDTTASLATGASAGFLSQPAKVASKPTIRLEINRFFCVAFFVAIIVSSFLLAGAIFIVAVGHVGVIKQARHLITIDFKYRFPLSETHACKPV